MHQATYDLFRKMIQDAGGIALGDDKIPLLRSRIRGRMTKLKLDTPEQYLKQIREDESGRELTHLIDSIATNYTFFFREEQHFNSLKNHVIKLLRKGQKKLRVWSAACSSGEEPYTIAMVVRSAIMELGARDVDAKILATDISTKILREAVAGIYRNEQISRVPPALQQKYFKPLTSGRRECVQVCEELRNMVTFRHLNLNGKTFPMKGPFDAVFCRNVMIYFDEPTRTKLVNRFAHMMADGAPLYVGMTESVMGYCKELPYEEPSVYIKK
ncbi:MAG: hypothetical protein KDA78_14295 [Planctomycetaceae bacterium]|nr:hypothetical protein [Planctomycetaceae bacterium]